MCNRQRLPALLLLLFTSSLLAQTHTSPASFRPLFKPLRYDEDWSFLCDPGQRTESLDWLKFIPISKSCEWYVSIGGNLRGYFERFQDPSWEQEPQDDNGFLLQRYMLHADLHMGDRQRIFLQIKSGLEHGRAGGPRPLDKDALDLAQAFIDATFRFGDKSTAVLRAGRQEMLFGSGRLVGPRDGPNVRLSFDGLSAILRTGGWQTHGFLTRPVQTDPGLFDDAPDHSRLFWGAYATGALRALRHGGVDLYYLGIDRKQARFDQGRAREIRHSIGARVWSQMPKWDFNTEAVFQLGSFGRGNILAWTVAFDFGYTRRDLRFSPRLGFRSHVASGDRNPSDLDLQTFNPLFPRGEYFGELGLIGLVNLLDVHPSADLQLTKSLSLRGDCDVFWRESLKDGVYGNGVNLLRSGQLGRGRYIGIQPSIFVGWTANSHTSLTVGHAHFFTGSFLQEKSPVPNIGYTTARVEFIF